MSNTDRLTRLLKLHEGFRRKPYYDDANPPRLTIAWGRNLDAVGVREDEAELMLANDIEEARLDLERSFPWFHSLDPVRATAVTDMRFNLGAAGFRRFQRTIAALEAGNYKRAAEEMLASRWAAQTKTRAERLAAMMKSGRYPKELAP